MESNSAVLTEEVNIIPQLDLSHVVMFLDCRRRWSDSWSCGYFSLPPITPGNPWLNLRVVTGALWGSERWYWGFSTLVSTVQPSQTTPFYSWLPFYYPSLSPSFAPLRVRLFLAPLFSLINEFIDFHLLISWVPPLSWPLFLGSAFFPWQQREWNLGHGIHKLMR